jgi:hypothetical protein
MAVVVVFSYPPSKTGDGLLRVTGKNTDNIGPFARTELVLGWFLELKKIKKSNTVHVVL